MIARLALLGAVSLVTMGAQSSCSSTNGEGRLEINDPPASGMDPTFTATLVLKDSSGALKNSFQRGELITMELSVRNRTDQIQRLTFADGGQHDFLVFNNGTHQLRWRWSDDKVFVQVTTELTFQPQETRTVSVTWDQVVASGLVLLPGPYEARGMMMRMGPEADLQAPNERASTLVPFTITP